MKTFSNSNPNLTLSDSEKTIIVGGKDYTVQQDVYKFIEETVTFDYSDNKWMEKAISDGKLNEVIQFLFALSENEKAWDLIILNKEVIDPEKIFSSKYFVWKKDSYEFYKYLKDNKIIEDVNYEYFEVISGKLHDEKYWEDKFNGHTVSEKLQMLHDAFNGINPLDPAVGLIEPSAELYDIIFDGLSDGEILDDFIIGQNPSIFFTSMKLMELITTKHLDPENYGKYANILITMNNLNIDLYNFIFSMLGEERLTEINIDSIEKLKAFLDDPYIADLINNKKLDNIINILLNSEVIIVNPNTVYAILKEKFPIVFNDDFKIELTNYKYDMRYITSYMCTQYIDTNYIVINVPLSSGYLCVFDSVNNTIYMNGENYNLLDQTYEDFCSKVTEIAYSDSRDDELFKEISEDEERYEEIKNTIKNFAKTVELYHDVIENN